MSSPALVQATAPAMGPATAPATAPAMGPATAPATTGVPALRAGTCQVWWARTADVQPGHDALLTPADVARRDRLRLAGDRARSTVAAALTRLVLARVTGIPAASLTVDRTCSECGAPHGKPRLVGAAEVHFSVSHACGCVALAVHGDSAVGIDVEEIGSLAPGELAAVADAVLAPEERAELASRPAPDRARGFTTYWTRKEAVAKATGQGLGVPLDRIAVSPPSAQPRVIRWDGQHPAVTLCDLSAPGGYVAAVAVLGDAAPQVVELDASPLLAGYGPR